MLSFLKEYNYTEKGYVTLISVLVGGAIVLSVTIWLLLLGIGSSRTSFARQQSNEAKAMVNACIEEGLQRIRESFSYSGTDSLTLAQGSCTYTVTNQGGQNRTIQATGTAGTIVRKVSVTTTNINPFIILSSWQERSDF